MLKNLKALFIIEEEEEQASSKKKSTKKTATKPKTPSPKSAVSTPSSGKVNSKFMDILFGAMDKNNLEGFDYLEFKQSLSSLEKMPMDEATKYKSAFAMANTMGATKELLQKTANHYLQVLSKENQKFEAALQNQQNLQVGNKQEQLKQIESTIKAKADHIKQLTKEIEALQKETKNLNAEIDSAKVKMQSTKNDFEASYNALIGKIQKDIENMQNYL